MSPKKVLIISHDYPPIGSAGSQRVMKFAHYLPGHGYEPLILTTGRYGSLPSDRVRRVYRAPDLIHSLFRPLRRRREEGIAQDQAFRVATVGSESILGRLRDKCLIPDTKIGWALPAIMEGRRIIAEQQPDIIFSSSPPETTHVIAYWLNKASGIPWVADLRDGWLFEPPDPELRSGKVRTWLEERMEHMMVRSAAAITTNTETLAADFRQRYGPLGSKALSISNGYDPAEFAGLRRERGEDGRFLLVHTGSLSASSKVRSGDAFFQALSQIVRHEPLTPLRVCMVGVTTEREQARVRSLGLSDYVQFVSHMPNRGAHQYRLDADLLVLITAPGQRGAAPSKLYEYIGAGVPILALTDKSVSASVVNRYELGVTVPPDDADAIALAIESLMRQGQNAISQSGLKEAQQRFDRRVLTGELAALFDRLLVAPTS